METNLIINIEEEAWLKAIPEIETISNEVMAQAFDYVQANEEIDFFNLNKPINISLNLSNNTNVHKLNKKYRNKDKPTNVLSFANIDDEAFEDDLELFDEIELGDIIIAYETCCVEAEEKNISLAEHYAHLLTHGILHLLGFDHLEDDEAEYMESFEIQILKKLNINNPYEDNND